MLLGTPLLLSQKKTNFYAATIKKNDGYTYLCSKLKSLWFKESVAN